MIRKISIWLLLATLSFSTVYSQAIFHGLISETGTPPVYDADYQAVLNRATTLGYTLPDASNRATQNQLVLDLKAAGIWALLDVFYPMFTNIDFATLNWISPSVDQLTLVNSPTYDVITGFTGNGTTIYINTGWQPSSATNFLQNTAGIGYGCAVNTLNANYYDAGAANDASGNNGTYVNPRSTSDNLRSRLNNSTTTATIANASSIGRYHLKRTASTGYSVFKDGSSIGTSTVTSTTRTTFDVYVLAMNFGGTTTLPSARSVRYFWAGASLDTLEATFDAILATYYP